MPTTSTRNKGGRPVLPPARRHQQALYAYVTPDVKTAFKRIAYEDGISASMLLRKLVHRHLAEHMVSRPPR